MSQFPVRNAKGQDVIYGFDHVSGYFIQVHDANGTIAVDRSSALDGLTGSELVEVAEEHGITLPEEHMLCAMLDLPIGEWNPLLVGQ